MIAYKYLKKMKASYDRWREKMRFKYLFKKKASKIHSLLGKKSIIILSSDCVGGRVMNDFQLPVYTPTVNNWYSNDGFLKLCENLEHYMNEPVVLSEKDDEGHYTGILDDITIHFGHEDDPNKAIKKWNRGCKMLLKAIEGDHDFLIVYNDRNHFEDSYLERFENLPYNNKILFTHKKHAHYSSTFYMDNEDHLDCVKTMTLFENYISLRRRYDRYDFYKIISELLK